MDQNDEMEVYNSATTSFDLVESVSKMQSLYVNKEFAALGDKTWIEGMHKFEITNNILTKLQCYFVIPCG